MTPEPNPAQAAAEEISVRLFGPGDEPMTRIIQGILAKHFAPLHQRITELEADYGKLIGVVRCYVTAPGQVRGEAYRELAETFDWLEGKRDDLAGWPMCYEREKQRAEAAETACTELTEAVLACPCERCHSVATAWKYRDWPETLKP